MPPPGPLSRDDGTLKVDRGAKTLRELALEKMREGILRVWFRPGDRLTERDLCERLGVSRTVVRECLRHLEAEGLVETVPHHGPIVAQFDRTKVDQIYEIRGTLEAMAAENCAKHGDPRAIDELEQIVDRIEVSFADEDPPAILEAVATFYDVLFRAADKNVAHEIVRSLNARINHLRAITISSSGRAETAIEEMRLIHAAIRAGDPATAHQAALDHVESAAKIARDYLESEFDGVE